MHTPTNKASAEPIAWHDDALVLLDQTRLPHEISYVTCHSAQEVGDAIRQMVVRGAPAIGISAAYAVALAARDRYRASAAAWRAALVADIAALRESRPTAVNLMWALDEMLAAVPADDRDPFPALSARARELHAADIAANRCMGDFGAALIEPGAGVLTHCNAGALATAGYGTALGVIRSAWRDGRIARVYATETRPWLQGARLTAWELMQDGIEVTLIADSAAASVMRSGAIDWVITGADRIAANGDSANKIGTYALATLARAHRLNFMIAAPLSTIDRSMPDGGAIPIEERAPGEITHLRGIELAAPGVRVFNPVFDVTPAHLIDALATEKGVVRQPTAASIAALFED